MSSTPDQYRDYVEQNQRAFQSAVDTWSKTVEQTVAATPTNPTQVDPQQVVNQVFDFAERMLAMQRDFTTNLLSNTLNFSNKVSGQTGSGDAGSDGSTPSEA
jgi:hypothetical protein